MPPPLTAAPPTAGPDDLAFAELAVTAVVPLAVDVVGYTLADPQGGALPPFAPGAHVPVRTPAGVVRRYSLCNDPAARDRYEIAVKRDAAGRGGSVSMADRLRAGDLLPVAAPRNEFALHPRARRFLFVAGGIGITPFRSMLRDAARRGDPRSFTLLYGNRTPQATAWYAEWDALAARLPRLAVVHCMSEPAAAVPPWTGETGFVDEKLVARHVADPSAPVWYVVGPPAMTAAVRDVLANLGVDDAAVRVEDFAGY